MFRFMLLIQLSAQQVIVELKLTVYVFSAVQTVPELEDRRDRGCNNCWFDVDVVLVIFSCRQSRTVYCVEAFVSSPS